MNVNTQYRTQPETEYQTKPIPFWKFIFPEIVILKRWYAIAIAGKEFNFKNNKNEGWYEYKDPNEVKQPEEEYTIDFNRYNADGSLNMDYYSPDYQNNSYKEQQPPQNKGISIDELELKLALEELENIVGLKEVKQFVRELTEQVRINIEREKMGQKITRPSLHTVFTGNPGTGKTTIARIFARILAALNIVESQDVIEVTRDDLVAAHVGETALKTREVIEGAIGGILFIDEAYSLARGSEQDFGKEAIDMLVKGIEENRDNMVVILAGYTKEMKEFMKANSGLKSRFPNVIEFADYTPEELLEITKRMIVSNDYYPLDKETEKVVLEVLQKRQIPGRNDTGNGRLAENLLDDAIRKQSSRLSKLNDKTPEDFRTLLPADFGYNEIDSQSFDLENELSKIIGNEKLKQHLRKLAAQLKIQKMRLEEGLNTESNQSLNMIFSGNPGTGKTTIARIISKMLKELGILKTDIVIEVDRSGLVVGYKGQTAPNTHEVMKDALGGVLFIDEAYALKQSYDDDLGQEAINALVKGIEDHKGNLLVILAGYTKEMEEFLDTNSGLKSRFPFQFEFEDYSLEELTQILNLILKEKGYVPTKECTTVIREKLEPVVGDKKEGNARFVRNLVEKVIQNQSFRLSNLENPTKEEMSILIPEDFGQKEEKQDAPFDLEKELNNIIGNEKLKQHLRKLAAQLKIQKIRQEQGLNVESNQNLNMIFTGNPGTGKTTIARIISKMLHEMGILKRDHVEDVDRSGLVAGYQGQTALKTHKEIQKALGGVLFIDEAYGLKQDANDSFGQEAINTLVKGIEDNKGNILVILAGYTKEMEEFLGTNSGLKSRFPYQFEFEDYSLKELAQILNIMLKKHGYTPTKECVPVIRERLEEAIGNRDEGNGRFVRNLVEKVIQNQSYRISNLKNPTKEDLTTLLPEDFMKGE